MLAIYVLAVSWDVCLAMVLLKHGRKTLKTALKKKKKRCENNVDDSAIAQFSTKQSRQSGRRNFHCYRNLKLGNNW